MRRHKGSKAATVLTVLALALTGCSNDGPSANQDPRLGRVVIDSESCLTGACFTYWKVCSDRDLIVRIDETRRYADHEDCVPS